MSPRKVKYSLAKGEGGGRIREAAVEYIVNRQEEPSVSTISSKNQITLPAQLLRQMGLGAGDRLAVSVEGNRLVLGRAQRTGSLTTAAACRASTDRTGRK